MTFCHVIKLKSKIKITYRFGDEVKQMDTQADFLLVVTWPEGKGHLVVSGVHHVFAPLCEAAGDRLQNSMNLKKERVVLKMYLPIYINTLYMWDKSLLTVNGNLTNISKTMSKNIHNIQIYYLSH